MNRIPYGPCMTSRMVIHVSDAISDTSGMFQTILDDSLFRLILSGTPDVFVVHQKFPYIFHLSSMKDKTKRRTNNERGKGEEEGETPPCLCSSPSSPLLSHHLLPFLVSFKPIFFVSFEVSFG